MDGELTTLDHVVVAVRELDPTAQSYARLLGRAPSWRGEHPAAGTQNALFRLDNTYVELLAATGPGANGDAVRRHLDERGEGLFALAFGTRDAEACRARLAEAGLAPGPVRNGVGRDSESGAFREWCTVLLPPARTLGVTLFAIEHRSPAEILAAVGPVGEPSACVHALDHVVVRSGDGDASGSLYGDALGLRLALDRSFERFGFRALFFRVGGATVEVTAPLEGGRAEGDRLWGLAWRVGDIAAARTRLAEAGLDVSEVRGGRKPGTSVCTVRAGTAGVPTLVIGPAG